MIGWKARTLSVVGKVVIIKSNLIGIHQYSINWFKFSKSLYKEIDIFNREYFQSDNCDSISDKDKLHTLAWNKIYRPKCEEGLGITKTEDINTAFLTK